LTESKAEMKKTDLGLEFLRLVVPPFDIPRISEHSQAESSVKGGKAAAHAVGTLDTAFGPAHDSIHPGNVRI
jgi:hypothetical protein